MSPGNCFCARDGCGGPSSRMAGSAAAGAPASGSFRRTAGGNWVSYVTPVLALEFGSATRGSSHLVHATHCMQIGVAGTWGEAARAFPLVQLRGKPGGQVRKERKTQQTYFFSKLTTDLF